MSLNKIITGLAIVILILVIYVALTVASVGRFSATHAIVRESYCIGCHLQELVDLNDSRHMGSHVINVGNNQDTAIDYYIDIAEEADINGVCLTCHNNRRNLFGATDPYIYGIAGNNTSVFNGVVIWDPDWELNTPKGGQNETITVTLHVKDIIPENESVFIDASVLLMNISKLQDQSKLSTNFMGSLSKGESATIFIEDIYGDYFRVRLGLSGEWNFSSIDISVDGTDSVINSTDGWVGVDYILPSDLPLEYSFLSLFHTRGNYTVKRLDRVIEETANAAATSISINEMMKFYPRNDSRYTCGTPNAMCHINSKMTFLGQTFEFKNGGYYAHEMEYTTTKTCKVCHI